MADEEKVIQSPSRVDEPSKLPVSEWIVGFVNIGEKRHTIMGAIYHKEWSTDKIVSREEFAKAIEEYRKVKII